MPVDALGLFNQWGFAGLMVWCLFALIIFLLKTHKAERQEWLDAFKESMSLADTRQAESNAVIRELASVVRVANERTRRTD